MTSVDEIMAAIGRQGDDCIRDADAASESFEALREMIAAALADAERKGAEAMREAAGDAVEEFEGRWLSASAVHLCIRALPLPTGSQPAGAVPGEWIKWQGGAQGRGNPSVGHDINAARAIEAAVLAAKGLEVRRG